MGRVKKTTLRCRLMNQRRLANLRNKKGTILENIPVSLDDTKPFLSLLDIPASTDGECFVKTEADASGSCQLSPPPRAHDNTMHYGNSSKDMESNRCILCNLKTKNSGIPLNGLNGNEDYGVMFLLLKILKVPGERLETLLPIYNNPKNWVSSCDKCTVAIQRAFKIQSEIEQLEKKLRKTQSELQAKICKSWNRDPEAHTQSSKDGKQPISVLTRKYVATGNWDYKGLERPVESKQILPVQDALKQELNDFKEDSYQDDEFFKHPVAEENPPVETCDNAYDDTDNGENIRSDRAREPTFSDSLSSIILREEDQRRNLEALPKFCCKLCPSIQPMVPQIFSQHILYHKRRPFKCRICGNYLTGKPQELDNQPEKLSSSVPDLLLRDHRCSEGTLEKVLFETYPIWSCHRCSEQFSTEDLRDSHAESCGNRTSISKPTRKCVTCTKLFLTYSEWHIHRALEHPEVAELSCFRCDAMFRKESSDLTEKFILDRAALKLHRSECPESTPGHCLLLPECEFCGEIFLTVSLLGNHVENCHFVSKQAACVCRYCFVRKPDPGTLSNHVKNHSKRTLHVCDICGYSCVVYTRFLDHCLHKHGIRSATKTPHKCSYEGCSFEAYTKEPFTMHKHKVHSEPRQHKCQQCGKEFLTSTYLKDHELTHTNKLIKPYQCEICGTSFAVKNYLYIHTRLSHLNRPFASTHKKKPARKKQRKASVNPIHSEVPAPDKVDL